MKRKIFGRISTLTALALIAAAVLFLAACGQRSSDSKTLSGGQNPNPVVSGPVNIVLTTSGASAAVSDSSGAGIMLDAYVTVGGAPKTNLTTAGEDAQFTFSLGIGSIVGVTNLNNGHYTAKLTSQVTGTATVTAVIGNYSSDSAPVEFTPGPVKSVSILASKSTVSPDNTDESKLTVTLKDTFGNNTDGKVTVTSDLAGSTITPADEITTSGGVATATFKATVSGVAHLTATVTSVTPNIVSEPPVSISVYTSYLGVPHHISAVVDPPEISVKETGGVSVSKITVSIYDYLNNLIDDSQVLNNVKITILQGPNGGENIQGYTLNQPIYLTSHGGVLEFSVSAGKYPGSVTIEAEVLLDAEGNALSPTVRQNIPKVYIRSGPSFSLVLQRENSVISNGDGTLSQNYFGLVSDKWGNDISDGTSVFFGQIVNMLTWGIGTVSADGATFTSTGIGNILDPGDTVVITDMITNVRGGYIIDSIPNGNTVMFASPVSTKEVKAGVPDASGLVNADGSVDVFFVGGNNDRGGVFQGNAGGAMSTTIDGIAVGKNTYPGYNDNCAVDVNGDPVRSARINEIVAIWAGTEDETIYELQPDDTLKAVTVRGIGDAEIFGFGWVLPTLIRISGATEGLIPGTDYPYTVTLTDSSDPTHYRIPFLGFTVSAGGGTLGTQTSWEADTYYTRSQIVIPTTPNGHIYQCITEGITGAAEPAWKTDGTDTTDGSVVWADRGTGVASAYFYTDCVGTASFTYRIFSPEGQLTASGGDSETKVKVKQ